ncbi:hypothetical protein AMTRI_Chr12g235670 [Amborella trichopoda]
MRVEACFSGDMGTTKGTPQAPPFSSCSCFWRVHSLGDRPTPKKTLLILQSYLFVGNHFIGWLLFTIVGTLVVVYSFETSSMSYSFYDFINFSLPFVRYFLIGNTLRIAA